MKAQKSNTILFWLSILCIMLIFSTSTGCSRQRKTTPRIVSDEEILEMKKEQWLKEHPPKPVTQEDINRAVAENEYVEGVKLETGCDGIQNYEEACVHFQRAATLGNVKAQYALGKCYYVGRGVPQSYHDALRWLDLAAQKGHVDALELIAEALETGKGVAQNYSEARRLYSYLAEEGDHGNAQLKLGIFASEGLGQAPDDQEAFRWFARAVEKGIPEAQYRLGMAYLEGRGTTPDKEEAEKYLNRARANGWVVDEK